MSSELNKGLAIPSHLDDDILHINTVQRWNGQFAEKMFCFGACPWYVYHMSTMGERCEGEECAMAVQRMQLASFRSGSSYGARYNFVIGTDGKVYEMRGWLCQPLLPRAYKETQKVSILIGYIGTFRSHDEVPPAMKEAAERLIQNGGANGFLTKSSSQKYVFSDVAWTPLSNPSQRYKRQHITPGEPDNFKNTYLRNQQ